MGKPNGVLIRKAAPVTSPHPVPISGELDLSQNPFWEQPPAQRYAAYAQLRAMQPPPFFDVPENPFGTDDRGYYALVRHADVAEASRHPELFSSGPRASSTCRSSSTSTSAR
jgi:cytochrome P450